MTTLYSIFGILPWIHRYCAPEEQSRYFNNLDTLASPILIAVSSKQKDYVERIEYFLDKYPCSKLGVKVDVANGSSRSSCSALDNIKKRYPTIFLCSGNVCTIEGAKAVIGSGADAICVGLGGGSSCVTRMETGIGIGNAHAVYMIAQHIKEYNYSKEVKIIADGGFKKPADIVKALALGADICMSGRLFQTGQYYYGMASQKALEDYGKYDRKCYEGECLATEPRSIEDVVKSFYAISAAIKSALSYLGYGSVKELSLRGAEFNLITQAVWQESIAK